MSPKAVQKLRREFGAGAETEAAEAGVRRPMRTEASDDEL